MLKPSRKSDHSRLGAAGIAILMLIAWEVASRHSGRLVFLFSRPSQIVKALVTMAISGKLLTDIGVTTAETLVGTAAGTILGSALGLALWLSKRTARVAAPFVVI